VTSTTSYTPGEKTGKEEAHELAEALRAVFGHEGDVCSQCGRKKIDHTQAEASYCITRTIAQVTDKPVHITGP